MSNELVSIKTRQVFREHLVGWTLREISDEFDAAMVECDLGYQPPVSGQRRTLIEQYYHSISWADWGQVKRILRVFETVLFDLEKLARESDEQWRKTNQANLDKLTWCLKRDGLQWMDGRIVPETGSPLLTALKETAATFDVTHMMDQIRRMESAVESDPSLAIGTAKELVETCCKTILTEREVPITGKEDIPALTKAALKTLKLVPDGISDEARGSDVIRRILSNLGTIGNGLAELRGLYGTGHGRHGQASALKPRHAKLAVGAAATLVVFLFETHQEVGRKE